MLRVASARLRQPRDTAGRPLRRAVPGETFAARSCSFLTGVPSVRSRSALVPGVLYIEQCPPAGYLLAYAVNIEGSRCFQVQVRAEAATPELIDRWRDDARQIASPRLQLVRDREAARVGRPRLPRSPRH